MGNPLKEVELKEAGAKPSTTSEAAEVSLISSSEFVKDDALTSELHKIPLTLDGIKESQFLNGKLGHEGQSMEENPNPDLVSFRGIANGRDNQDQAPLLSQANRSHELQEVASSSDSGALNGTQFASESFKEMEIKYAAYVRKDMYGNWGTAYVSFWEKLQLLVAVMTLCPVRVFLLASLLVLFYLICKLCTLRVTASSNDEGQESFAHMTGLRRIIIVRSGRFLARVMLFVFGFYYIPVTYRTPEKMQNLHLGVGDYDESKEDEEDKAENERPGAIVCNHVSYLDILYHMSASFPSFVAKRSVGNLPLVGLISKCLGCVYVQREAKSSDFKGVSGVVMERLQAAHHDSNAPALLLFPEGTTTNGEYLLPFKTGAFRAQTPVKPVILKYPYKRFSPAWESISGTRHVILLLCQFVNYLEVVRLPVYVGTQKEYADPNLYANNVRTLMAAEGNLILSDVGLYEKRIFHAACFGTRFPIAPALEDTSAGSGRT